MKIKAKCKCGEEVEITVPDAKVQEVHHHYHPPVFQQPPNFTHPPTPYQIPPVWC